MNAKHTPGPWRVGDAGATVFGRPRELAGLPPKRIASLTIAALPSDETKANARLIAEAPAMVEALRHSAERFAVIAEWCDRQFIASNGNALLNEIRKDCKSNSTDLRAILARIEGDQ